MGAELPSLWLLLLLLGAGHGINPGMGWLFAVARGLQEEREAAVWRTLLPLATGHALAIGAVVVLGLLAGLVLPLGHLKWAVAATLLGFGIHRLRNGRHPMRGGMRVGARDLTVWSFLMASAHGAGLMVLPFLLAGGPGPEAGRPPAGETAARAAHGHGMHHAADLPPAAAATGAGGHGDHLAGLAGDVAADQILGLAATLVHTAGYLLVTGLIALVVYRWLGLQLLRAAWINLDRIWAGALIATAILTPLL